MGIETRPQIEMLYQYTCEFDAVNVLALFWRKNQTPDPNAVTNFIGAKVPAKIHPPKLNAMLGKVENPPNPGNWHADIAEWAAALRSVRQAEDTYRIVELGCGWGCWLTNMGVAARSTGLKVDLIGIEGNDLHLINADETLRLNGFEDGDFSLYHAIAAPTRGKALFPSADAETTVWDGEAIFYPDDATLAKAEQDPNVQILHCVPLSDLSQHQIIDLLHVDIQGAEVDYVEGNFKDISSYVRRVLIGTHSRSIEGRLIDIFQDAGWRMEMERPALTPIKAGKPKTTIDGVQMWANPALN